MSGKSLHHFFFGLQRPKVITVTAIVATVWGCGLGGEADECGQRHDGEGKKVASTCAFHVTDGGRSVRLRPCMSGKDNVKLLANLRGGPERTRG